MTYKDEASQDSTCIYLLLSWTSKCGRMSITRWRRPVGCLQLQVIWHKRATNYRALLRKMTYKDKASYDSMCIHLPLVVVNE